MTKGHRVQREPSKCAVVKEKGRDVIKRETVRNASGCKITIHTHISSAHEMIYKAKKVEVGYHTHTREYHDATVQL